MRKQATRFHGSILFDPDAWIGREEELKLEQHRLSETSLLKYARMAVDI